MDFASLHELLRSTYDEMMPLCAQMTGIAKGIAGLGALFYIALRVWASIARAEWIIEAGGGIGSYGRNVNQTARHGAQGAYTGGKAAMAGAGAAVGNVGGRIKGALLKGK